MGKSRRDFSTEEFGRKKRKVKYTSILFAIFTLGVNIFAWFAYVSSANLEIDASVAAWDVVFSDNNGEATNAAIINVNMLPGMEPFSRTFRVVNRGEVVANFSYVVKSMELFGNIIDLSEEESSQVIDDLKNKYPFSISFNSARDTLGIDETVNFHVNVNWDYDSEEEKYYNLDKAYSFDPTLTYYSLGPSGYAPINVNASEFLALRNNLYLDKDSADSYFGEMCGEYEKRTHNACLKLDINMIVQQKKDN